MKRLRIPGATLLTVTLIVLCGVAVLAQAHEDQSTTFATRAQVAPVKCPAGMHLDGHHGHTYLCGPDRPAPASR